MDPTACLRRIGDADTRDEQIEACCDLAAWLARGGFAPDWNAHPEGTRRYRQWQKEEETEECDECGAAIPVTPSLVNKHHADSCSLHDDESEAP